MSVALHETEDFRADASWEGGTGGGRMEKKYRFRLGHRNGLFLPSLPSTKNQKEKPLRLWRELGKPSPKIVRKDCSSLYAANPNKSGFGSSCCLSSLSSVCAFFCYLCLFFTGSSSSYLNQHNRSLSGIARQERGRQTNRGEVWICSERLQRSTQLGSE